MLTKAQRVRLRDEMRDKLASYHFDWFVTLVLNEPGAGHERMRTLLKAWDAGVNREINGPKWQKRQDQRLLWFAFPEKIEGHPHWHLVVQVDPELETPERKARAARFPLKANLVWNELCRSGSYDCREVASEGVFSYVTKELTGLENYERFIFWREFMSD